MKLITLNTWGGRAGKDKLQNFIKDYNFCDFLLFQEAHNIHRQEDLIKYYKKFKIEGENVWSNFFEEIRFNYADKIHFFSSTCYDDYGPSMHINKNMKIQEVGDIFVYKEREDKYTATSGNHSRSMQYSVLYINDKKIIILNIHGIWNGMGKGDSDDRILQSQNIINFLEKYKITGHEIILAGDFNLLPDTQSIKMLEDFGLINLIKVYDIKSTRTSHYTKTEKYADYIFMTEGIKVNEFKVLPDEVSDHSPLYLDFDVK